MARRGGFLAALELAGREGARQQRLAEASRLRALQEQERCQREQQRLRTQLDKAQRQQYLADRTREAEDLTAEVEARVKALRGVLEVTLRVDDTIPFQSLRLEEKTTPFSPPAELCVPRTPPQREDFTGWVKQMTFIERLFSSRSRYERELQAAEYRFTEADNQFRWFEEQRVKELARLQADHEAASQKQLAEIRQRNAEVDELENAYRAGESHAVIAYCAMVLERSRYPEGFPQTFRLAYVPDSKELVIDYELPTSDVVPGAAEFRFVKAKDAMEEKARKVAEIRETYQDVVAAVALRTLHEVFEADQGSQIGVAVFNGFVSTVDPAIGKDIKPYLISVRTTKDRFAEIDLHRIDKKACLRNLGAQVSPQPAELLPVKPLIEFDMVDKRFVEGSDVLADLESRPNLMELTPFEFEELVTNLFSKMGLETKQTRSSRDGGVDAVAFDTRPLIGGKVVIQAKRYRHAVGVSAVRDLFGTMTHEGANKGILVTTSGYGTDSYDFIKGKPIELIDGGGLLYYLELHAGVKARIVFPVEE